MCDWVNKQRGFLTIVLWSRGGQWTSFWWPRVVFISRWNKENRYMRGFPAVSRNIEEPIKRPFKMKYNSYLVKRRINGDAEFALTFEKMELIKNLFLFSFPFFSLYTSFVTWHRGIFFCENLFWNRINFFKNVK